MNAIVLARGEKSKRLGKDKSLIMFCGKTMLELTIEKISDLFSKVFIVSIVPERFENFANSRIRVIKDEICCGPLGAIYTGLKASSSKYNFVVACDLPFLSRSFVSFMSEKVSSEYEAIIPQHNGCIEVLHAFYSKKTIPIVKKLIEQKKYQVREVLKRINVRYIKDDEISKFGNPELFFFNINTQADLKRAREIFKKCGDFQS